MRKLLERLRGRFLNRRKAQEPITVERRSSQKVRDVDARLHHAVEDLEQTLSARRDDWFKRVANDIQQEVIFSTFREVCSYKSGLGQYRICRHPKHSAANSGLAPCDEQSCPIILGKTA